MQSEFKIEGYREVAADVPITEEVDLLQIKDTVSDKWRFFVKNKSWPRIFKGEGAYFYSVEASGSVNVCDVATGKIEAGINDSFQPLLEAVKFSEELRNAK